MDGQHQRDQSSIADETKKVSDSREEIENLRAELAMAQSTVGKERDLLAKIASLESQCDNISKERRLLIEQMGMVQHQLNDRLEVSSLPRLNTPRQEQRRVRNELSDRVDLLHDQGVQLDAVVDDLAETMEQAMARNSETRRQLLMSPANEDGKRRRRKATADLMGTPQK